MYKEQSVKQVVVLIGLIGILMLSVSPAWGKKFKPGTTISWLAHPVHYDTTGRGVLLDEFEKKTGIKVEPKLYGVDETREQLMIQLATGSVKFDVLSIMRDAYRTDLGKNTFVDLSPRMHEVEDFDDFSKGMIEMFRPRDGSLVSLPLRSGLCVLMYRQDLYQEYGLREPLEEPQTIEEFLNTARKLTFDANGDGHIDVYGYLFRAKMGLLLSQDYSTWLNLFGTFVFDKEGTQTLIDSPAGIEALQFLVDLVNKYKVTPPGIHTYGSPQLRSLMQQGKYAQNTHWWNYLPWYDNPKESKVVGKVKVGYLPRKPEVGLNFGYGGGWALFIDKNCDKADAAWEFIKYITSYEAQVYEMQHGNGPTRVSVFDHPSFVETYGGKGSKIIRHVYDTIEIRPQFPGRIECLTILATYVSKALTQEMPIREALSEAVKEMNAIITESR